jgi:CheY-like chemotaxis protein
MQKKKTVLLIDDDIDDQEIFSLALSRADQSAECICSNDALQALEKIGSDSDFIPDYIFVDMNMPRMNGTQCLSEIKKIERLKNVPVFIYSTSSEPTSIVENKNLGAEDFIVKPADINILTRLLSSILKSRPVAIFSLFILFAVLPVKSFSQKQQPDSIQKVSELKKLSVEELMNIVVTTVSKTPENLSEDATSKQVKTGEEKKRSTAPR